MLAIVALSNGLFAQTVYVPQTISTPYGNVTTQRAVYMPMNYGNYGTQNIKFEITVVLKNDSVINLKSHIESEEKKMYVVYKVKKVKRKIFPNETREIYGNSSVHGRMMGIPADSCWLFKAFTGAINSYLSIPIKDYNMVIAIQQGNDGVIIPLNKKNLEAITGTDDPKIVKWLSRNKLSKVLMYYNEQQRKKQNSRK
jgi:hypothetical protein